MKRERDLREYIGHCVVMSNGLVGVFSSMNSTESDERAQWYAPDQIPLGKLLPVFSSGRDSRDLWYTVNDTGMWTTAAVNWNATERLVEKCLAILAQECPLSRRLLGPFCEHVMETGEADVGQKVARSLG